MTLIVLLKPIPDLANLSISRSQEAVFEKSKRLLNPADEGAVEAALQWKSALGGPVTVATVCAERDLDLLRKPLAMGADAAVAIVDPGIGDPCAATGALIPILQALVRRVAGGADIVVCCGTGSRPRGGSAQTGPRLAEALSLPCLLTGAPTGPAVCMIGAGAFKPRPANALAIMKAVKRPIERLTLSDLGVNLEVVRARVGSLVVTGRQLMEAEE